MASRLEEKRAAQRYYYRQRKQYKDSLQKDDLTLAIEMVQKYWTLHIVRHLADGAKRFVKLECLLGCSSESLRSALTHMEEHGLINGTRYKEVPPRKEYELTERGRGLVPVVLALEYWTMNHEGTG